MEKKIYPYVVLDSTTLVNGIRVLVDGVDTKQFEKNPVALYLHNDWSMPIGTWENVRIEKGQLLADFVPDYDDPDKEVQRLIGKIERGVIKMASAGLVELKFSDSYDLLLDENNIAVVTNCRLREISIAPIGQNHNALRLFDDNGKELNLYDKGLNLSDYFLFTNNQTQTMKKEILMALNLADGATPAQIDEKVELLLADKQKSDEKAKELQGRLDAIDAAKKEDAKKTFALELADAFKDGRLTEKPAADCPTPVKNRMLNLFDLDPEGTLAMLKDLPKHTSASDSLNLGDGGDDDKKPKETAFQKRQREIEEGQTKK